MRPVHILVWLLAYACPVIAQNNLQLSSPDRNIQVKFLIRDGQPQYSVTYKNRRLLDNSTIGLTFAGNDVFGKTITITKSIFSKGVEAYTMPVGKTSKVSEPYTEVVIPMFEPAGRKRQVNFHIRIFNDGVAFRYELIKAANWQDYMLSDENTSFNIAGNPVAKIAFLENFNTSHEHRYADLPFNEIRNDTLMDMPALFSFPGKIFMAITEASLINYAGMSLMKKDGVLTSTLSPLPGQKLLKVKAILPHHTPWRVLMIGDRIGKLIESNILTNLNEPCKIKDVSWLKPGKATFHWWSGDVLPDTSFEAGVNFNFNKYYIDFCARNGIQYHTVIGNRGVAWYQNDGNEYQPGPNTDITTPRVSLNMQQVCDYAKSKGVGIRFWVHWKALYSKLDSAFTLFEKWGISGMMVDFMDRDDQEMINIQEEILQKAAAHHLEIQFHGVSKPTGLNRTYPNESTREGTLNYENNKWGNLVTPDDDINIPFTRLLAGPTDYHLGGFRAMLPGAYKQQYTKPYMLGTRCHMLAMYVVLENSMSMICDYPAAYEGQQGFELLQAMPTTWDETIVPGAEMGKWVSVARRKGNDWYIGTITNGTARSVTIPLQFLSPGNYTAQIYNDAPDASVDPNKLVTTTEEVNPDKTLVIKLAEGGGNVIKLHRRN